MRAAEIAKGFAKALGCLLFRYIWPVGQAVKTAASHAANMGSIPVRVTIFPLDKRSKNEYNNLLLRRTVRRRKLLKFLLLTFLFEEK